jgi:hypothetical protein
MGSSVAFVLEHITKLGDIVVHALKLLVFEPFAPRHKIKVSEETMMIRRSPTQLSWFSGLELEVTPHRPFA